MAAVLEKHMDGRQFLVGDNATVADFVAAYTLDMATVQQNQKLLDALPHLRAFMEQEVEGIEMTPASFDEARVQTQRPRPPEVNEAFVLLPRPKALLSILRWPPRRGGPLLRRRRP